MKSQAMGTLQDTVRFRFARNLVHSQSRAGKLDLRKGLAPFRIHVFEWPPNGSRRRAPQYADRPQFLSRQCRERAREIEVAVPKMRSVPWGFLLESSLTQGR